MAYYSFVVIAPRPLGITKPLIMIDQGLNTFTAVVDDLEALLQQFRDEEVIVTQVNRLDQHEQGCAQDILLEGETPESLRLL